MNMKSFFLGLFTGAALAFVGLLFIGLVYSEDENYIEYQTNPVSYENKAEASFKVFQVLEDAALARESKSKEYGWYYGNIVLIPGENYYTDQVITIKKPQIVGTYNYVTQDGLPITAPVLNGEISK